MAKTKKETRAAPRSALGRLVPKDKRVAKGRRLMRGSHIAKNIRARVLSPTLPPNDESDRS